MPGKRGLVSQEVAKRNLDGLDMLREANKHYEEGLAIFREGAIKQLQTLEKEGFAKDLSTIAQTVIQPKKPELVNNYLKAELFSLDGKERFHVKSSREVNKADELGIEIGKTLKKMSNNSYKK